MILNMILHALTCLFWMVAAVMWRRAARLQRDRRAVPYGLAAMCGLMSLAYLALTIMDLMRLAT